MLLMAVSSFAASKSAIDDSININDNHFTFSPIAHAKTAELLAFITSYESLNKAQQESIYMEVAEALAQDQHNVKLKIKRAAILSLPNSSLRDQTLAEQHLKALMSDTSLSTSNADLVKVLHMFTMENHASTRKIRDHAKKVDALKQKNKALSQKLNDLKNIEKTMTERNAKANNK